MFQPFSRTLPELLTLAAVAAGFSTPSFATPSLATELPERVDVAGQVLAGPQIQLSDQGTLTIVGDPTRPLLLLGGESDPGVPGCGRRVLARDVTRVPLGPAGRFEMLAPASPRRMTLQVWQPPSSGETAGSGYSVPVSFGGRTQSMASTASVGDLVITEFMKDPSAVTDGHGEWIEVYNAKPWRLDIEGVTLSDFSGASYVLSNAGLGILLAPGERYVLGNDDDPATNGGVPVDHEWSSFSLKNSSDEILLYGTNGLLIDAVVYDDGNRWPDSSGMSISLTGSVMDTILNDTPSLWCHSSTVMALGGDTGTPGAMNDVCP